MMVERVEPFRGGRFGEGAESGGDIEVEEAIVYSTERGSILHVHALAEEALYVHTIKRVSISELVWMYRLGREGRSRKSDLPSK